MVFLSLTVNARPDGRTGSFNGELRSTSSDIAFQLLKNRAIDGREFKVCASGGRNWLEHRRRW